MRRNLLYVTVSLLAGVAIAGFSPPFHPAVAVSILAVLLLLVSFLLIVYRRQMKPLPPGWIACLFCLSGFVYAQSYAWLHANQLFPYYGQRVTVLGVVEDVPLRLDGKRQFTVTAERVLPTGGREAMVRDKIRVTDYRTTGFVPRPGDRVRLQGTLLGPSPRRNPGAYDDRRTLARQGIHARLSLQTPEAIERTGSGRTLSGLVVAPLADRAWDVLHRLFPPGEAELTGGLVIGFKSGLPEQWETAFQMLGLTHILAASGMNVGLIAGALFLLLRRLRITRRIGDPMVIGTIFVYTLLAGAGPSVVRAGWMAALLIIGASLGRKVDLPTLLAVAALACVLWNPQMLFDIGFILSFVTTLGLFLLTPRLQPKLPGPAWLRSALAVTVSAQIASIPVILYYFNQFSPFSLLANLYVMPLTLVLVPAGFGLILLGVVHPWLAFPFVGGYRLLLWLLVKPVVWLADATAGWSLFFASPPLWAVWLFYIGLGAFLFRQPLASRFAGMVGWGSLRIRKIGLLPGGLLLAAVSAALLLNGPARELRVTFLDVGQGDSALVETPGGRTILVDGGGILSYVRSDFDVGEKIVLPFLRHRGIRTIDYMVATHADEDHVRGLLTVLENLRVRNLIVSGYDDPGAAFQQLLQTARRKGIPIYRSQAGIGWQPEPGVVWRFFHPGPIRAGTRSDANANSVVFELQYGERRFLFAGDVEGEAEADFLHRVEPVDVLKVAHHGSAYSTTEAFLQRARPRYAVLSVGRNNRYGHPHEELLERLGRTGATILRTDQNGAVTVTTDGKNLLVRPMIPPARPVAPEPVGSPVSSLGARPLLPYEIRKSMRPYLAGGDRNGMHYETFVKQFVDIMDERAPVTLVRHRVDTPLGSVQAEQSTLVHARLDLLDNRSPSADIVISADGTRCDVDYIVHIPADEKMTDQQFVANVRRAGQVDSISVLQSIDGGHEDTYVVTGRERIDLPPDGTNPNSVTHDISAKIVSILKAGGYDPTGEDRETDDLVLWSPE